MITLGLALLLVALTVLHWRVCVCARHLLARQRQLIDLCTRQQHWIRRGEVACHNCPELDGCVMRGSCHRESPPDLSYVLPPMTMALYLPARVRFISE